MANTKVTQHVIANNAITADQIASAAVTDAKLHANLNLSSKNITLPAIVIPAASTTTTQAASDNTTKLATTAYVTTAIANLVDSSPSSLNTLNELAAALNDDASFSTTVTNSIATKLPLAGGTMTGPIAAADFEVDASGDINLDAGGGDWRLKDDGTTIATISNLSGDLQILLGQDKDYKFVIDDNGSQSTALLLDGSEAGFATFNSGGAFGGTGALRIPQGTTGQRPSAATGQIRWNTTDGALEVYNGSAWTAVGTGSSNKVLDTFTGDGSTTTFTLSVTPANEDAIMVFIDGAYQEKGDYVLTNNSLALDTAPLSAEKIAVHITTASVHDGTSSVNNQFTASGSATFNLTQDPKSENNTQVYINGVYQQKTDYTVTGTTLTFDTAPTSGDIVEVNMFTVATLGNTDTVTEGVSNLYHTTARARGAISVSGNAISYNSSTGVLTANFEEGPTFTNNVTVNGLLGVNKPINSAVGLSVGADATATNSYGLEVCNSSSNTRFLVDGVGSSFFYKSDNALGMKFDASTGNVIINGGTFSSLPTGSKLNIFGDGITLRLDGSSGTTKSILFRQTNAGNPGEVYADGSLRFRTEDASTRITFHTNSTGSNNERMRIDSSGKIGIGVTPDNILHVKTTASGGPQIHLDDGTNSAFMGFDGTNIQLATQRDMNSGTWHNTGKSWGGINIQGPAGGSQITVQTAPNSNTSPTTRFLIDKNGGAIFGSTANTAGHSFEVQDRSDGYSTFWSGRSSSGEGRGLTNSYGLMGVNSTQYDGDGAAYPIAGIGAAADNASAESVDFWFGSTQSEWQPMTFFAIGAHTSSGQSGQTAGWALIRATHYNNSLSVSVLDSGGGGTFSCSVVGSYGADRSDTSKARITYSSNQNRTTISVWGCNYSGFYGATRS